MKTLALGVLLFRGGCPVSEAYLEALKQNGLKPSVILAVDYVGEGRRAAQLERLVGTSIAAKVMRRWRNRSARVPADLVRELQSDQETILRSGSEPRFENFADKVIYLTVKDYSDPRLRAAMSECGARAFLYCSGGRVPSAVFQEGFKILHVHPGVLPHVRGSDGLLWSMLSRRMPGVSCFYMDAGIDTGALIATAEYPMPKWRGLRADPDVVYNALVYCYDPHLRAALLIKVLKGLAPGADLADIPANVQQIEGGHYYTMHKMLRDRVLASLGA